MSLCAQNRVDEESRREHRSTLPCPRLTLELVPLDGKGRLKNEGREEDVEQEVRIKVSEDLHTPVELVESRSTVGLHKIVFAANSHETDQPSCDSEVDSVRNTERA